ncbi:NTF2 fold immunity protein [Pseudomonas syringae]|uniref:NTF2 fold immunity protein n=1 Tax=Pseudomonas syringae TaxID=317 RepID=UPI0009B0D90B|nr:NTF2 fold immunity protein [Pseudomonas syringae]MDY2566707.1 NTF2 fold immunity protein [Pseudomonas syringae]
MAQNSTTNISTELNEEIVEKTFRDFSTALRNWENWFYTHKRENRNANNSTPNADERARAELLAIFSTYVTEKGRNYDRLENLVCSMHPEYEFEEESIRLKIPSKKTATLVYKKKHGLRQTYRLTFSTKDNTCRIQKREFQDNEKWRTTYI